MVSITPPAFLPSPALVPRSWIERIWSSIADRGRPYANVPSTSVAPPERVRQLAKVLLSERGEASGAAVARELLAELQKLSVDERLEFYRFIAASFLPDERRLRQAAQAYLAEPTPEYAARLAEAAEPVRQELLRRMNMSLGGTAALVAMRKELLAHVREESVLRPLDSDLRHLFASWFNRGFLELRRIDWQTPAAILERLIAYEAVHEIQGWEDLHRRLAPDRRCFGFFHPALPDEPLIFVEVALTEGLAAAAQPLLARDGDEKSRREQEARADTAIFYSISNCQAGLRGVSFGNFLIKQVVEELKAELPGLVRFATLSPVPGFRRWLEARLSGETDGTQPALRREDERKALRLVADQADAAHEDKSALLLLGRDRWWEDAAMQAALRGPLSRLCAIYLTTMENPRGLADPVARFHLGNGARLERINWLGNVAPRGIQESCGIMVNYLYDPELIEANHEKFVRQSIVVRSATVDALLAMSIPPVESAPRTQSRGSTILSRMRKS